MAQEGEDYYSNISSKEMQEGQKNPLIKIYIN